MDIDIDYQVTTAVEVFRSEYLAWTDEWRDRLIEVVEGDHGLPAWPGRQGPQTSPCVILTEQQINENPNIVSMIAQTYIYSAQQFIDEILCSTLGRPHQIAHPYAGTGIVQSGSHLADEFPDSYAHNNLIRKRLTRPALAEALDLIRAAEMPDHSQPLRGCNGPFVLMVAPPQQHVAQALIESVSDEIDIALFVNPFLHGHFSWGVWTSPNPYVLWLRKPPTLTIKPTDEGGVVMRSEYEATVVFRGDQGLVYSDVR